MEMTLSHTDIDPKIAELYLEEQDVLAEAYINRAALLQSEAAKNTICFFLAQYAFSQAHLIC